MYKNVSQLHLYFQENCKSDGAKLVEVEDSAEENFIEDNVIHGILMCFLVLISILRSTINNILSKFHSLTKVLSLLTYIESSGIIQ